MTNNTKENGIRIRGLNKTFTDRTDGTERRIFTDLDLFFPSGKTTCLMGESGCGKTTLLKLILGFEKPDSGSIEGVPEKISAVFQENRLAEDFSVLANVLLPFDRLNGKETEMLTRKATDLLAEVGLAGEEKRKVKLLSGGMQRRVAIVRALMPESDLLILDEPLKGLDEKSRNTCIDVLRSYGKTILMVTHDPEEAELLGADIVNL